MLLVTACVVYKAEIVETILKGFNNKKDHMCENKRLHKIPPNLKQWEDLLDTSLLSVEVLKSALAWCLQF